MLLEYITITLSDHLSWFLTITCSISLVTVSQHSNKKKMPQSNLAVDSDIALYKDEVNRLLNQFCLTNDMLHVHHSEVDSVFMEIIYLHAL